MQGKARIEPIATNVRAAAEKLGVSRRIVYLLAKRGEIQSFRIGRRVLILIHGLERFIARNIHDSQDSRS